MKNKKELKQKQRRDNAAKKQARIKLHLELAAKKQAFNAEVFESIKDVTDIDERTQIIRDKKAKYGRKSL